MEVLLISKSSQKILTVKFPRRARSEGGFSIRLSTSVVDAIVCIDIPVYYGYRSG